jgi:hypothetical protein
VVRVGKRDLCCVQVCLKYVHAFRLEPLRGMNENVLLSFCKYFCQRCLANHFVRDVVTKGDEGLNCCLLCCDAVLSARWLLSFRRNMLPHSSVCCVRRISI